MAPPPGAKSLQLRRPGRCAACSTELAAGQQALWYRGPRLVTCIGCSLEPPAAVLGVPGTSAQREYDRRHNERVARARQKLGPLGVILARAIDEPQSTTAWKRGAAGEARAGARLDKLLEGTGVTLLHDRRMPGSQSANIDHIAVGPGGITVIDTKNYRGKVRVERRGGLFSERHEILKIAGRDQTKLVDGVERQIAAVRASLGPLAEDPVDIRGALCFADVEGLPLLRRQTVRSVIIDGTRTTAKLARRPGPLSTEHVERIGHHLAHVLPPAWAG